MASKDHEYDGGSGHKISSGSCCRRCSHCDEHYYWDHLDSRQKHFFKVMVGDFQQEMTVPEKFANNFRGQISEIVKLEAPDGNIYDVHVSKDQNKLVLRSGWGTFSSAYELKQGDLLVFRYTGDSHFKVLIFDPSGCFAQDQTGGSSNSRKASKMSPSDSPSQRSSFAVTEDVPYPEDIQDPSNSGDLRTSTESPFILAEGCNLTREQRDSIDTLEKKIMPEIPLYITHLNKTSMSATFLIICKDYSDKHLPNEDQAITLCHPPDYKKRDANFKVSTAGAYIFSPAWSQFIHDNEVQESDAFAFEASKIERRLTVTVHPLQGSYQELGVSSPRRVVRAQYMVTKRTKLTPEQKKKVEEKLQEIQPATPVFLSIKKRCDDSMCFSRDFAVEYLPRTPRTVRLRRPELSCSWEVQLMIHEAHRLCRGWKQFVDDNALRQGDMCIFQTLDGGGEEQEEVVMNVHVIRGE